MKTVIKDEPHRCHVTPADGSIYREGPLVAIEFIGKKTPHWQRSGNGQIRTHLLGNSVGGWLSVDITESGDKSSKRVMLTLKHDEVEAVRDLCNLVLGDAPDAGPELLAALRAMIADHDEGRGSQSIDFARAVVAKLDPKPAAYSGPLTTKVSA